MAGDEYPDGRSRPAIACCTVGKSLCRAIGIAGDGGCCVHAPRRDAVRCGETSAPVPCATEQQPNKVIGMAMMVMDSHIAALHVLAKQDIKHRCTRQRRMGHPSTNDQPQWIRA